MKQRTWPVWAYYGIAAFVFVLDYVTKKIIESTMELNEKIQVLGDFFILTSIRNRGAAFGILQEQRLFFIIVTIAVLCGIIWYLQRSYRTGSRLLLTAIGMILGGALGNFLDRALYGEVVDFLQFNFGKYTFPIFNVADMGICIGVALVILDSIMSMKQENKTNDNDESSAREERQSV